MANWWEQSEEKKKLEQKANPSKAIQSAAVNAAKAAATTAKTSAAAVAKQEAELPNWWKNSQERAGLQNKIGDDRQYQNYLKQLQAAAPAQYAAETMGPAKLQRELGRSQEALRQAQETRSAARQQNKDWRPSYMTNIQPAQKDEYDRGYDKAYRDTAILQQAQRIQNADRRDNMYQSIRDRMEALKTGRPADYDAKVKAGREAFEAKQSGAREAEIWQAINEDRAWNPQLRDAGGSNYDKRIDSSLLNDQQKNHFYALYAEDPEQAEEWLGAAYERQQNNMLDTVSTLAGYNAGSRAVAAVGSAALGLASGLDPYNDFGQGASKIANALASGGAKGLQEKGLFNTGILAGTVDENVPILGGKGLGDLYQLSVSMLQSGALVLAAGASGGAAPVVELLGTTLMGSSAAASDYTDCIENRGMSREQAMLHATAAGIAEAAFEYVSLDKLVNQDITRGFIKNFFMQGGIEASEELCTTIANRITDAALARVGGYDTQIEQRMKELIALGLDTREAKAKAEQEWVTDLISDGLGGFLSGGVMTGINTGLHAGDYNRMNRYLEQTGAASMRSGEAAVLRQYAEDNGLGWYGETEMTGNTDSSTPAEAPAQNDEGTDSSAAAQNDKGEQKKSRAEIRQERQERMGQRQTGSDVERIQKHINQQMEGKSIQEQQTLRDQLQEKYGEGILPATYYAIQEDIRNVTQDMSPDQIRQAMTEALKQTDDREMRGAIAQAYSQAGAYAASKNGGNIEVNRFFQQLRNTGKGGMTLQATVTNQDGTQQQVDIEDFTEDGKGIKLSNGQVIAINKDLAKNLDTDADTVDVIQRLYEFGLGKDTSAVFQLYKAASPETKIDGYRWIMDAAMAFDQGRVGRISMLEAMQRSSLDRQTVAQLYKMGKNADTADTARREGRLAQARQEAGGKEYNSKVDARSIKGIELTEAEKEQFDMANDIFRAIGVDVVWFASDADPSGTFKGKNGQYLNGKVWLDIHAGRNFTADLRSGILATAGHELTHFLQDYAPKAYKSLRRFLLQQISQNAVNGELTLERLIDDKMRRSSTGITREDAIDEVVADACQRMLLDSKALHNYAEQAPSHMKRLRGWVKDWYNRIKAAFGKTTDLSYEARLMNKVADDVRKAFGDLWDAALQEAVETHREVGNLKSEYVAEAAKDVEAVGASAQMAEEAAVQNSDRIDAETLEFLDNQEHVTVYRAMQIIDGKLYPPMAAKVEGKLVDPTEIGEWYQAIERPDLIDPKTGKWKLDKANGKAIKAAYNPYFHTSATPLNDQFSSAYNRPNIVVVEGIIPKSELTSGYKAQYAKDSVGETKWHAGPVASKLKGEKSRRVFLSRWFQAQRVVSDAEVADVIAKTLEGENISIPNNVVTPSLLEALRERGVAIDDGAIDRFEAQHSKAYDAAKKREAGQARFSMRDSVETTDRLIAWHNMNEDALRSALELGGLAMPSWAIKTADKAHTSYGSISVIAPRSLVDPKQNRNSMIFGGDAWTPVFPGVDYDISYEATEKLYDEIAGLIGENVMRELGGAAIDTENIANQLGNNSGGVSSYYKNNTALRYAYLKSIGKDIAIPQRETRLDDFGKYSNKDVQLFADRLTNGSRSLKYYRDMSSSELMQQEDLKQAIADVMALNYGETIRKFYAPDQLGFNDIHAMLEAANKYFEANGVIPGEADKYALAKEIDKVIDEEAYEKWIGNKLNQTIRKKGIRNNKDTFTPSGNRRSFDALHYAYNLANIVKAMKAQPKQGRTQFLSGPGSVKGAALKSYNTVEQVRADRGRLVDSAEEGQAAYDEYNRNLEDILDRMSKNGDRFDAADALIEVLQHAKTETAIYNYMQRELKDWYNISRDLAHDVYALIGQINRLPMEYFEGKTYDAVGFDETAAVVVPDSIDQSLKRQLQQAGARVLEYKAGDNEDRLAKVNSVEEAKFSERDYSYDFSDTDLILDAADLAADPETADSYWKELLAVMDQKDARDARAQLKGIREQGKKIQELEAKLEDALHQMEQTDRKLRTQGIGKVTQAVMEEFEVSDAKKRGVAKKATEAITQAYQKALDAMDNEASAAAATDILYEGAVKAANILLDEGTHTERHFGKWAVGSYSSYIKEDRQLLVDAMVSKVYEDFAVNRYREPMKATVADRLVERTERRMQKKIDEARDRARTVQEENDRLQRDMEFARNEADASKQQVGELAQQLRDLRDQVKEDKQLTGQERSKAKRRIKTLENALKAKRNESQAWKQLADKQARQMEKDAHAQTIQGINSRVDLFRERLARTNEELRANKAERALNDTTRKLNETARKLSSTANQLQKQLEREQRILNGMLKPPAIQKLLKAEREKAVAKAEAHKDEVFRNYKERRNASDLRQRIVNLKTELQRRLSNPTDRSYVPAGLATAMVDLLDAIDNSPRPGTKAAVKYQNASDALRALAQAYDEISTSEEVGYEYKSEYDEELRDQIRELAKELQGKKLRDMSAAELQKVYDAVRAIRDGMRQATKMLNSEQWHDVYDAIRSVVDQQQSMTAFADSSKHEQNKRLRMLDNMSVMRAVEMMSGWNRNAALYQLMHGVENGASEAMSWVMNYNKAMQELKTGKNEQAYRRALTKAEDFGAEDKTSGKTVKMTKLQAIQLYMTWQREAHNDKLIHLQKGGATIRDAVAIQDGKGSRAASHTIKVTPELIARINDSFTDWDRAYMKAVRDYLTREAKATNQVLYKLKHRVLTTEDYYVPYIVDKGYLETKLEGSDVFNLFVKTPGSTQALQRKAPQPVIIDGMDTMLAKHVQDTANYVGLALPIRDFAKVYNGRLAAEEDGEVYTSLKKTIQDNFQDKGLNLIVQALLDVQGGSKGNSWSTHIAENLNKLQGAFVRSALLINPSVTLKQAASYTAAESVLSYRALVAGNRPIFTGQDQSHSASLIAQLFTAPEGKTAQRLYDEIDQHTSLHYERRLGMSQAELANEAQRSGKLRRWMNGIGAGMEQNALGHGVRKAGEMLNPVTWIQRMDVATTAAIWVACKQQARLDGMTEGSTEYWQRTTELYERVIRETQPMYDGLHRTANQKQHGGLMQYIFPFRTVPIQNHGQISAAYEGMQAAIESKDKARIQEAKRFFAKTVKAQIQSAVVFSVFTFLAAGLKRKTRKYRDEDEELDVLSVLKGIGMDTAGTIVSVLFPLTGSALWDGAGNIYDSVKNGKKLWSYDSFSIGPIDLLNEGIKSFGAVATDTFSVMKGADVSVDTWEKDLKSAITNTLKFIGIPASTITTYYEGIKGDIDDALNGRIPALNDESWDRSAAVNANRWMKAWLAGDKAKMDQVMQEMLDDYAEDGKTADKATDSLKSKLMTTGKEAYLAGDISESAAIEYLVDTGFYDEDEAWAKIQEWDAKADHAGDEEYHYSKYAPIKEAIDQNKDISSMVSEMTAHGAKESDVLKEVKEYLVEQFVEGNTSEDKLKNQLSRYLRIVGSDANDIVDSAKKKIRWKALENANPGLEISESACNNWYDGSSKSRENGHESAKAAGMSIEQYLQAKAVLDKAKDANGNGTGEDEVIAALSQMNLTARQKDALYYERYKGTTKYSRKTW